MRNYYLLFALIIFKASAQLNLEHCYEFGAVTRVKLQNSGEKYYELNRPDHRAVLYNSDHSVWKSIELPLPQGEVTELFLNHISDDLIDPNALVEIIYSYSVTLPGQDPVRQTRIINEEAQELFIVNTYSVEINQPLGLTPKLFVRPESTDQYKVYALPGLALEHTFQTESFLHRALLENSGEKYYYFSNSDSKLKIFNTDFTNWKSIDAPKQDNYIYDVQSYISENRINPDAQIEAVYRYAFLDPMTFEVDWSLNVINESEVLLAVPRGFHLDVSQVYPDFDKTVIQSYTPTITTTVYSAPNLQSEHAYGQNLGIFKLENAGFKYVVNTNGLLHFYNLDHTLWKSVSLPMPQEFNFSGIMDVSEQLIQPDSSLEIVYRIVKYVGTGVEYGIMVCKEDGAILNEILGPNHMERSEFSGMETKFIATQATQNFSQNIGSVYSINALSISDELSSDVKVYPNPTSGMLHVTSSKGVIAQADFFTSDGKLVRSYFHETIQSLNVEGFASGLYLLRLKDADGKFSMHKIAVSR